MLLYYSTIQKTQLGNFKVAKFQLPQVKQFLQSKMPVTIEKQTSFPQSMKSWHIPPKVYVFVWVKWPMPNDIILRKWWVQNRFDYKSLPFKTKANIWKKWYIYTYITYRNMWYHVQIWKHVYSFFFPDKIGKIKL